MSYNESLNPNSNYPEMSQSEWDRAPWNQEDNPEEEIEVTISMTLSKNVKIKVTDYIKDEDGNIDYSDCNLREAVMDQIYLPCDSDSYLRSLRDGISIPINEIIKDLSNWDIDDLDVVL